MFLPPCWHFLAPQAVNIWRSQRNANILANAKVFFQQAACSTYTKQRHKHIRYFHLKWPKGCHHNLHSGEVQSMGGQQGSFSYSCLCQHSCQSKQLTNFKPYQHPKGGVHKGRGDCVLSALQARLVYTAVSLTAHRIHSMYRGFYILASDEPIPIVVVKCISAFVYFFFFCISQQHDCPLFGLGYHQ